MIPKKFYKHGEHPVAATVGELKAILAELPDDLRISDGWGGVPAVVVYNHGRADVQLQLCEQDAT